MTVGQDCRMVERQKLPRRMRVVPVTRGHFRRRVAVMRKPVAVPVVEETAEQMMRRRPEVVAVVRRTPWKNSGLGQSPCFVSLARR